MKPNRYSLIVLGMSMLWISIHVNAQSGTKNSNLLDTRITIHLDSVSFEAALQLVSEKTGLTLNYNNDRIPVMQPVTLHRVNRPAREIFDALTGQTGTRYILSSPGALVILPIEKSSEGYGTLRGHVFDKETGTALAWANVLVDGTRLGAASNARGDFIIERVPAGMVRLVVRMMGYRDKIVRQVIVGEASSEPIQVDMEPKPLELDVVTVTGMREKRLADQLSPGVKAVRTGDVLNTAGSGEDLFRTIQSLPGVVARTDASSQFYVRGGTPDQNLIIVDNVPVFNPYRLKLFGGPISMFNPDVIEYVELMPGGFPAQYGDKLSAVLMVKNKEGNRFEHHLKGGLSLIDARVFAEGPVPSSQQNGSWLVSGRRTYYDLLLNEMPDLPQGTVLPYFQDFQTKIVYDLSPIQKLRINVMVSDEGMELKDLDSEDQDDREFFREDEKINLRNGISNRLVSAGWVNAISDVTLSTLTLSQLRDDWFNRISTDELKYDFEVDMNKLEIREDIMHVASKNHTLQGGFEVADYISDISVGEQTDSLRYYENNPLDRRPEDGARIKRRFRFQDASTNYGFYIQDEWKAVPPILGLLPGLRVDYSSFSREWVMSPRVSGTWQFRHNAVLHAGWGLYYQAPNFVSLFERFERKFDWNIFETISLKPEKAVHYMAGLEWEFGGDVNFKLDGYYKDLQDVVAKADSVLAIPNNSAEGFAYGFEVFLQKRPAQSPFYGWISYSYGVTRERLPGERYHYRDYDLTHAFNVVLNTKFSRHFSAEIQYKYNSGFPWTPIQRDAQGNARFDKYGRVLTGTVNGMRNPYYSRLDTRFSYQTTFGNGVKLMAYLEAMNLLNRNNVYKYYWNDDYSARLVSYMLPFIPSFGIKFEL